MKNLLYLLIFLSTPSFGQSLYDMMTEDELVIGSAYFSFSSGNSSYWFCDEGTKCGMSIFSYYSNHSRFDGTRLSLDMTIEDEKVYRVNDDCSTDLLYDFSLTVGDSIESGTFKGFVLDSISTVQLLDGTTRQEFHLYGGCLTTRWIYGIGDIVFGFIPSFNHEVTHQYICTKIGGIPIHESDQNVFTSQYTCDNIDCFIPAVNFDINISNECFISPIAETLCATPSLNWDFGDDNFSNDFNPAHNYKNPGCYEIKVGAFYNCSEDTVYHRKLANICVNDAWKKEYGFELSELNVLTVDESIEYAFNKSNLYKSIDKGQTWIKIELPPREDTTLTRGITDIQFFNSLNGIMTMTYYSNASRQDNIYHTIDGGETWIPSERSRNFPWTLELGENGKAWSTNATGEYLVTNDYGKNWTEIDDTFDAWSDVFHYVNSQILFRVSRKGDYYYQGYSNNNGQTFDFILLDFIPIKATYLDRFHGYILASEGLYNTSDGGNTWQLLDLPFTVQDFAFYSNEIGWLQTDLGAIYYSNDRLNSFEITYCGDLQINNIKAIDATHAQGVKIERETQNEPMTPFETKVSFNINLVGNADCLINSNSNIESELLSLYPNPATNQLSIDNNSSLDFTVEIFSLNGAKRIELQNQNTFDISKLANGIYFLRLTDLKTNNIVIKKFTKL